MVKVLLTPSNAYIKTGKNVYKRSFQELVYGIAKPHKAEYRIREVLPLESSPNFIAIVSASYNNDHRVNSSEDICLAFDNYWTKEVE